jgi:predicted Fe-S protein YdhL (DUF1289 family)
VSCTYVYGTVFGHSGEKIRKEAAEWRGLFEDDESRELWRECGERGSNRMMERNT